ncbi:MAG TPA: tetratricopeptide repeat protein [Pyrinomonadaceae bacterium]|nr:tetratricopeptide repeat protein [Pyrinomonadaceae bacterium]
MNTRLAVLVLVVTVALLQTTVLAQTTNPPYLSQMPAPSRVKAEIKGSDTLDTAARQAAAFWHLMWIIRDLNGPRDAYRQVTPDAQRLINMYSSNLMWYSLKENAPPAEQTQRWTRLRELYENDPVFLDEVLQQLFSEEFRAGYYRAVKKQPPPSRSSSTQPSVVDSRPSTAPGESALNFHGLYRDNADDSGGVHSWLRFYEDGTVIGATSTGASPEKVAGWLKKPYENSGRYTLQGAAISFTLASPERKLPSGSVIGGKKTYTGTIGNNSLRIDSLNGQRVAVRYEFLPLSSKSNSPAATSRPSLPAAGRAEDYFAQGEKYFGAHDHARANEAYKKAIALKPSLLGEVVDSYWLNGTSYEDNGDYQLALSAYKHGLALKPDAVRLHVSLGYLYLTHLKQYGEAVAAFEQAIRVKPDAQDVKSPHLSADAHLGLGKSYLARGRKENARGVYRTLLSLDKAKAQSLLEEINRTTTSPATNKRGNPASRSNHEQ